MARRVLLIKADNSLLIFSELGSYKPLNWMASPSTGPIAVGYSRRTSVAPSPMRSICSAR